MIDPYNDREPTAADIIEHLQEDGREIDAWEVVCALAASVAGPVHDYHTATTRPGWKRCRLDDGVFHSDRPAADEALRAAGFRLVPNEEE